MLLVITGVPGTGKSSVAKELVKQIDLEEIDLKELAFKKKFLEGYDSTYKSMIINEKKISKAVKSVMKKETDYIFESHLSHFVDPKLTKLCIILRCNPKALEKRLKKRRYSMEKIAENVMSEYLDSMLIESLELGHKKHLHEIDTTDKSIKETVAEIRKVLKGTKKKGFGKISWLR